jgi:hypothetical protein
MRRTALFLVVPLCLPAFGQSQLSEDSYTRYELLDPASNSFRIYYEVSAATPGSAYYYNTLRPGSEHSVTVVTDLATGNRLSWTVVTGKQAREGGFMEADAATEYLKVQLARPVPANSEYRLLIDKTYKDPSSYFTEGDKVVFSRSLSIPRNSVVLPRGYEIVHCNTPSQVILESDGRVLVSFLNTSPGPVQFRLEARKLRKAVAAPKPPAETLKEQAGAGRDKSRARVGYVIPERAHQTREIVYFLQQPETHSFRLYHDYTETRAGVDRYLNVVRAGSKASNPSARNLDSGKDLKVETLKGDQITARKIDIGEAVTPETEVVVIWFDPVRQGESVRLRIEETYTDPTRYLLWGEEFVWDRAFGRVSNDVVLPEGWLLTHSSIPCTVSAEDDGRIRLRFVNPRPDEIDVFIKGQRR